MTELTIEQQLKLRILSDEIARMPLETARSLLLESVRQSMVKDNLYKELLKQGGTKL